MQIISIGDSIVRPAKGGGWEHIVRWQSGEFLTDAKWQSGEGVVEKRRFYREHPVWEIGEMLRNLRPTASVDREWLKMPLDIVCKRTLLADAICSQ